MRAIKWNKPGRHSCQGRMLLISRRGIKSIRQTDREGGKGAAFLRKMATCKVYAFEHMTATTPVCVRRFKSCGIQIEEEWTLLKEKSPKVPPRQCVFLPVVTSTTHRVCARLMWFVSRSGYFWLRIDTITARMTLLRNIARQVGISGTFVFVFALKKTAQ